MSDIRIIETQDGSHSLFVPELNETYHSFHGALQEAEHVFIKMGLHRWCASHGNEVKIYEVGFGTGLNALLTLREAIQRKLNITYTTIEAFPVDEELLKKLNYIDKVEMEETESWFQKLHDAEWNKEVIISENFTLHKIKGKLSETPLASEANDVVYFDAFAPSKQADMWEYSVLEKVSKSIKNRGIFTTYCATGQLKRDLKELGFEVETLPGPPGKKEMVRGTKA